MSDHVVTLVDLDVTFDDAPRHAARMVAWLKDAGIVGAPARRGDLQRRWLEAIGAPADPRLVQDDRIVHPPGPAFRTACTSDAPLGLVYNWLEVEIGRRVFTAGEHGIGIFCPACGAEQTALGDHWGEAIGAWAQGEADRLACAACGFHAPLRDWRFDPPWGFGMLGFSFCNWTLDPAFIDRFTRQLGHAVRVVHCHR